MASDPNKPDPAEEDHVFRPRIGRRRDSVPERAPNFRALMARAIAKQGGRKSGQGRAASKRGHIAVRVPQALSRRCIIKARYVAIAGNGRKLAKAHLAYLERDGVERDGSPGRLYGADGNFDSEAFHAPIDGEPRQFRFIVSPEDAERLNLTEFTRQFMRQVEKDTGRSLDWAAVNHHNTDNPHVHIVVRGLDRRGDEVRIDGRYIAREMRWRAREVATRELGPRTELELSRTPNVEIERARYTSLDQAIESLAKADRTVSLREILTVPGENGRHCVARLKTLETFQLVKLQGPGVWRLADGWTKSLREMGEYLHVVERLRPLVGNRAVAFQIVDERSTAASFEGRVVGKGLDDELGGRMFVAVQTSDGRNLYVRVAPEMGEPIREGDAIRVRFDAERWVKPADKIVARFAEVNRGIYDPSEHRRQLEALPQAALGAGEPTSEQRVAANVRRLERLERYQLATHLPDGRWKIPPDLVTQLEDRERTHPQQRMQVERVGPERNQTQVQGPARERSELTELAEKAAKDLRLAYVSEPPTFTGRLLEVRVTPSGREYVLVVDHRRGQFTVIPKPPDWERFQGRTVHLSRDRDQKLVIQLDRGLSR
jgi:type IV secretory pathway VirD2 relaxase